jgi:MSHA biogenesis protein MshQ
VDVTLDVPSWLEFDWNGSGAEDPMGTATFGRHRGHDRIIYWSEQR